MKDTPENSTKKLATADPITAAEAFTSNASATPRSISPRTTTPSAVLSRSQVGGIDPRTVYTCAATDAMAFWLDTKEPPERLGGSFARGRERGDLPLRISWWRNYCR